MTPLLEKPDLESLNAPESFTWLRYHAESTQVPRKQLSKQLGYDESTLSKVLNLTYTGNPEHISRAIEKYRASTLPPVDPGEDFPFVATQLTKSIWGYINLVRTTRKIGMIISESQGGKTRAQEEFERAHPELDVLAFRIPPGGHRSKVVAQLCDQRGVSLKYNTSEREMRLVRTSKSENARPITRNTLVFVDEIQQCAARSKACGRMSSERIDTIEFLRWLHDVTRCPMVLFGTTEALNMMNGKGLGHDSGHILLQTLRRSLPTYTLKSRPIRADLNAFAAKLGLTPASGPALTLQTAVIDQDGLGNWLTLLQAGNGRAAAQGRTMTWSDVLDADTEFQIARGRK